MGNEMIQNGGRLLMPEELANAEVVTSSINNNTTLTLTSAIFSGHYLTGPYFGGAVANSSGGVLTISSATFIENTMGNEGYGGAIGNQSGGIVVMSSAIFVKNTTGDGWQGGAIYNAGNMVISSAVFTENCAPGGGAIYTTNSTTLGSAVFAGNSSLNAGGAIQAYGILDIGSALFSGNIASRGGAIYNNAESMILSAGDFTENTASSGGAILNGGTMTLTSTTFTDNSAGGNGGAVYNDGGMTLTSTMFSGNSAGENGGAINNSYSGKMVLSAVTFSGNQAAGNGGAIYNNQGWLTLADCSFTTRSDTVYNSGWITVEDTVSFTGDVTLALGSVLLNSGTINLNVSTRTAEDDVLIDGWKRITGNGDFTITVGDSPVEGLYRLASGCTKVTDDFTVHNSGGTELGELSVGGSFRSGGYTYTLELNDGVLALSVAESEAVLATITGKFGSGGGAIQYDAAGAVILADAAGSSRIGTLNPEQWTLLDSGDFDGDGKDGLLWLEKATGNVYMQNDLSGMAEVIDKKNRLGTVADGYTVKAAGDFLGTGLDGALMLSPASGDSSSTNYGLAVWGRETDGATPIGWLGALVNTWDEAEGRNTLKGDFADLSGDERNAVINANNYRYELVGTGDFNGDGRDDVILRNNMPGTVSGETITGSGDVFIFLTDTRENVIEGNRPAEGIIYTGCVTDGWEIVGFGDFNGDGTDDILLSDGLNLAGWQMEDGARTRDWSFGSLTDGWKFAGVGDFDADGTDDILLADPDNNLTAWTVKNGKVNGTIAIA